MLFVEEDVIWKRSYVFDHYDQVKGQTEVKFMSHVRARSLVFVTKFGRNRWKYAGARVNNNYFENLGLGGMDVGRNKEHDHSKLGFKA